MSIEAIFPRLRSAGYRVTSPFDPVYNCIAYAAGDRARWWEPSGISGHYWPPSAPLEYTLDGYRAAFESLGYVAGVDDSLAEGIEKVALYVDASGSPTHAARQLRDGSWTSKLGRNVDIVHDGPDAVGGSDYGEVALILSRLR